MPVTEAVAAIIEGKTDVATALEQLMSRPITRRGRSRPIRSIAAFASGVRSSGLPCRSSQGELRTSPASWGCR